MSIWKAVLIGLPLLLAAAVVTGCSSPAPQASPDVVLVVIDALRADHLSHAGYGRDTAAGLDRFAASATRFADCRSSSSWTNPSIASLFTGLDPPSHRTNAFGAVLAPELVTLAEVLQGAGWHTAAVSFNPGIRAELGFDQGFAEFDQYLGRSTHYPDVSEMLARVDRWLEAHPPRPFLLYLHPMNVHGPYRVPEAHAADLLGRPPGREFRYYQGFMKAILREGRFEVRREVPQSYVASLVDQYDTAIHYTCRRLGELFDRLDRAGILDGALVIVTADHGEELFDHGGFSHGWSLHDEVLHVPLYVKLPHQRQGRVEEEPAALVDLAPTIFDVLGVGPPAGLDGRSLAPLLDDTESAARGPRPPRIAQTSRPKRCVARAIELDHLKLIDIASSYEGLRDAVRLYDLEADPGEHEDLATSRLDDVVRLRAELERRFAAAAARDLTDPAVRLDALDHDRLEALGYLDSDTGE